MARVGNTTVQKQHGHCLLGAQSPVRDTELSQAVMSVTINVTIWKVQGAMGAFKPGIRNAFPHRCMLRGEGKSARK